MAQARVSTVKVTRSDSFRDLLMSWIKYLKEKSHDEPKGIGLSN